jgi:GWxTD domain-containing protein
MLEKNLIHRLVLIGSILASSASINFAQPPSASDPRQKPKNVKKEDSPDNVFKKWLAEDVPYIITRAEKEAFDKLTTNEERENFIATFWQRRDPDPDTEENEYREEFYERISYANEHFRPASRAGKPIGAGFISLAESLIP